MKLADLHYEQRFEIEFLRTKGDAFQTFFERLMGLTYKADFMACRPWGTDGDRKNDGYLKSERRLFQVYAPNDMDAAKAKAKITADFEGAKQHWKKHFDQWTFVHNATDGLPPHVHELILSFEATNPGIKLEPWCLEELRAIFRRLSDDDKASWFGAALTEGTAVRMGFADLKVVLERIEGLPAPHVAEVKDVPPGKIEANALSPVITQWLRQGLMKSYMVAEFLAQWHDETLGERLAEAFKAEYKRLRGLCSPNLVFAELQSWAGGDRRGSPEHELAVLTVMAYYFERCDIFEAPRSSAR